MGGRGAIALRRIIVQQKTNPVPSSGNNPQPRENAVTSEPQKFYCKRCAFCTPAATDRWIELHKQSCAKLNERKGPSKKEKKRARKQARKKALADFLSWTKEDLIKKILEQKQTIIDLNERNSKRDGKSKAKTFYDSREWMNLRFRVLKAYGRKCAFCKTTTGEMHVDHIKPRSLFPDLELVFENLQVLCRSCNIGKSNTEAVDYRET